MITRNTEPKSPFGKKISNDNWQESWDQYTDNEKVYILNYLNKRFAENGESFTVYDDDPFNENEIKYIKDIFNGIDSASQKQNMTLDGFSTTKDLDRQLETILKSIEPEVMKTLKKTKYFDKKE